MTRHRVESRRSPRACWLVSGCGFLLGVVAVVLPLASGLDYLGDLLETPEVAVAVSFSIVGAVLAARSQARGMAWLLAGIGLMAGVYAAATSYAAYVLGGDAGAALPEGADLALVAAWLSNWAWFPAWVLMVTVLPQVLPTGRPLSPRWRPPLVVAAGCVALGVLDHATEPGPLGTFTAVPNPIGLDGLHDVMEPVWTALAVVLAALVLVSVVSLVVRFTRAEGADRWQVGWFGYAVGVALLLSLVTSPIWVNLAVFLIPAGLAVAPPRPTGRRRASGGPDRAASRSSRSTRYVGTRRAS